MSQSDPRRGRTHNAAGAREAILNAAERVFAEQGFDGARIDTIAETAGYAKGLIFQYFGDKLALYSEVIRRADNVTRDLQTQPLSWFAEGEAALDPDNFVSLLKQFMGEVFDFYLEHPQTAHILLWEMADGWQTYSRIAAQIDTSEIEQLKPLLSRIEEAGLLHADFDPLTQFVLAEMILMIFQACIPLFQRFLSTEGLSTPESLARARDFIVEFVARGLLADRSESRARDA